MSELPHYYTVLFNAATDAIAALERLDFGTAKTFLIQGQQRSEDAYQESKADGRGGA